MIDPAFLGRFVWQGYGTSGAQQFNTDLAGLFSDRPDLNNANQWPSDRTRVVLVYAAMRWQLNITTAAELFYSVCQADKAVIMKSVLPTRGPDFGQIDLTNVPRGPCLTEQPTDQL